MSRAPLLMVFCLATACRTPTPVAAVQSAAPLSTERVALVYMGGFNSCGGGTPRGLAGIEHFDHLRASLAAAGKKVSYVLACYNGLTSGTIRWLSSAAPDEIYALDWRKPGDPGQVFDEASRLTDAFTVPLFMIGHSYGGWLAANMAANVVAAHPELAGVVKGLYTIDPISPYHCNQVKYAATVARSQGILGGPADEPCQRAPLQLGKADGVTYPAAIANNADGKLFGFVRMAAKSWLNFYQEKDFLHSSPVIGGDGFPENKLMPYDGPILSFAGTPHLKIHKSEAVWAAIGAAIRSTIFGATPPPTFAPASAVAGSADAAQPSAEPTLVAHKDEIERALRLSDGAERPLTDKETEDLRKIYGEKDELRPKPVL